MLASTDPALRKFPVQETNQGIPQEGKKIRRSKDQKKVFDQPLLIF